MFLSNQSFSMKQRDQLQQAIYVVINPLVRGLIKIGFTPNMVTALGAVISLVGAAFIAYAGIEVYNTGFCDLSLFTWAAIIFFAGSMFDMLDGQVARLGNMSSRFGAFFDSVLDKYTEMATQLVIAFFCFAYGDALWALVACLSTIGSMMVSYVRARAEGLGLECKGGFMQRPERVVIICVACLLTGLLESPAILEWSMAFIAVFANLTALWRIGYCRRQLNS